MELKDKVYNQLETLKASERVTKKVLAQCSRDALVYVMQTHDIAFINRLLKVLTPMNRKAATLYFCHFLPWEQEKNTNKVFLRFGKMKKERAVKKAREAISDWLSDRKNNIWTWADQNIEVEQVQVDLSKTFRKALKEALEGVDTDRKHGEPLTVQQVVDVVLSEITFDDMFQAVNYAKERMKQVKV